MKRSSDLGAHSTFRSLMLWNIIVRGRYKQGPTYEINGVDIVH